MNGEMLTAVELFTRLNKIAGAHGVGRVDMVENRLVGMKSRGVYETPAGTIVLRAHQALESICLDKSTMHYKDFVAVKYAELVYNGMWFMRLREALDAFVKTTQGEGFGHSPPEAVQGKCHHCRTKKFLQSVPGRLCIIRRRRCV